MFMHFRGGGIGHRVTREWDGFLQHEGRKPPLENEDVSNELQPEDFEDGDEPEWDDGIGMNEEGEGLDNSKSDESDDEEDDPVVADDGEELDEEIWAREGYGTF
jgi:hypothetical protein